MELMEGEYADAETAQSHAECFRMNEKRLENEQEAAVLLNQDTSESKVCWTVQK